MFVRYSMSTITLKKIVEPKYYVRPTFNVDYYTSENRRDDVCCSSDIQCRLLNKRKSSSQCIMCIRYSMSIITLEKIVEPMYYVCLCERITWFDQV